MINKINISQVKFDVFTALYIRQIFRQEIVNILGLIRTIKLNATKKL